MYFQYFHQDLYLSQRGVVTNLVIICCSVLNVHSASVRSFFEKNFLRVSRFRFYNILYICFNVYGKHSLNEIRYRILWWIPIVHIALLIVNLFLVLSVYIHTVTCYTLYLSQVSCTVARGNPPFSILNFSRIHYLRSKWIY